MRWARRILYTAMAVGISIVLLASRADRGTALSVAGQLVLALLTANLALVLWEVRELSAGLAAAGLGRTAPAQMALARSIRRLVSVLVVMLVAGSALMYWAYRLLPMDTSGEFALLFWVLLASGFALSIYVAELVTHLIHAFEAALLQLTESVPALDETEPNQTVDEQTQTEHRQDHPDQQSKHPR